MNVILNTFLCVPGHMCIYCIAAQMDMEINRKTIINLWVAQVGLVTMQLLHQGEPISINNSQAPNELTECGLGKRDMTVMLIKFGSILERHL